MQPIEFEKIRKERKKHLGKAIFFALLSFFFLASMSILVKASAFHTTTTMILFFQNLISLLLISPFVLHKGLINLKTKRLRMHLFRAATGTGCWYCLFLGLSWIVPANAVLLTYSAPLWMPLLGWILFRQKGTPWVWASVALGFVGIALVIGPAGESFQKASFIAVAAAILLAFALFSVHRLSKTEPILRILFYYFLLSTIFLFPLLFFQWQEPTFKSWMFLLSIGFVLTLSQLFLVLAYRNANPVKLSPFIYTVIVFFALLDWLIFKRTPHLLEVLGMGIVILGGIITALSQAKRDRAKARQRSS